MNQPLEACDIIHRYYSIIFYLHYIAIVEDLEFLKGVGGEIAKKQTNNVAPLLSEDLEIMNRGRMASCQKQTRKCMCILNLGSGQTSSTMPMFCSKIK